jgi:hypothetical protein
MSYDPFVPTDAEDVIAEVTEIAYQALLRDGIAGSFVDVELRLWREIRAAYYRRLPGVQLAESA